MPVNRKRIVKAIINDLETFESNADQFVVTAESLVSSYRVERAVKVTEIDLAYYQSEPIELPVIYGEEFLYKAYVVTKQGRQSVVSEFTKTISKSITVGFDIDVTGYKTRFEITPLPENQAIIDDTLKIEWVISTLERTLNANSIPTHTTEVFNTLFLPANSGQSIYIYGRRVDLSGNESDWLALGGNPVSVGVLNKTDVGLSNVDNTKFDSSGNFKGNVVSSAGAELINTSNRIINPNLENYKKVIFTPASQVANNDPTASLNNWLIPTFLLGATSQTSHTIKAVFNYVKQTGDTKIKLRYRPVDGYEDWTDYPQGDDHYYFRLTAYNEDGTGFNGTETNTTSTTCEVDISNNTNFPVGELVQVKFTARRNSSASPTPVDCRVVIGEAYVV